MADELLVQSGTGTSSPTASWQTLAALGILTANPTITLTNDVTGTGTGSFATTIKTNVGLAGNPTTTTQSSSDSSTRIATTAFVQAVVANAIAGVNPAVAVSAATAAKLPNSPTYTAVGSGIGDFITTATTNTALVVDGQTINTLNQRVLVKNEGDAGGLGASKNGVYFLSQIVGVALPWILTRSLDFDQPSDMNNTGAIPVLNGTANADTSWVMSSTVTTVGSDPVTFAQFSINPINLLSNALTSAFIFVGNGSNQATGVAMSGGATISNSGVVTLGNPGPSTLGGVQSIAAVTSQWIRSISTSGVPALSQPAFTDISGAILTAQITTANVTYAKIQNVAAVSLLGNPTGSPAPASEITLGPGLSFAGTTLQSWGGSVLGAANVAAGGTGDTTLTAHAVLLGEGTSPVAFATIGTSGRPLLDQGASADPAFLATGVKIDSHFGVITTDTVSGGAVTCNLATSDKHNITLVNGTPTTISLSNATTGQIFRIKLIQDGTGSCTVVWFTTIKWAGGNAPTLTTTASKADTFVFECTGSNTYDGYIVGQNV